MTPSIFVYGTLRPEAGAHRRLLTGYIVETALAALPDHALYGRTYRYPFAVAEAGGVVIGDVLIVPATAMSEVLAMLDDYEGEEYVRAIRRVEPNGGDPLDAWVYLAVPDLEFPPSERIISGDWLNR